MAEYDDPFVDRPAALLSKKERAHLLGLLDEHPREDADAIRQREYRIREHLRHGLIDFALLARRYNEDIARDFEDLREANPSHAEGDEYPPLPQHLDRDLYEGISGMFELLYVVLADEEEPAGRSAFHFPFDRGVSSALVRLFAAHGFSVTPEVGIHPLLKEQVPLPAVKQAYNEGNHLTPPELDALWWGGLLSWEERQDAAREWREHAAEEHHELSDEWKERREETAIGDGASMGELSERLATLAEAASERGGETDLIDMVKMADMEGQLPDEAADE